MTLSPAPNQTYSEAFLTWESLIGAFVTLADPESAAIDGLLAGRTLAVKDVICVEGLPTRNGSRACGEAAPASEDATVVARLRAAGVQVVGKTVTTEFAFTDPTPCRNPYALDHSPGGSSSGSGAAVGAGIVDIALGTQTAGSLIRPAAYCGAVGFKPGLGVLPMDGVTPLSPSHDMVGFITRDISLAQDIFAVMTGAPATDASRLGRAGRLLLSKDVPIDAARMAALDAATEGVAARLGPLKTPEVGVDVACIVADHRTVMCAEAAKAHGALLLDETRDLLQPNFREALLAGKVADPEEVAAAARRLADARTTFWQRQAGVDVIVTPPVPQGPPLLGASTGFQHWLTVWTVLGGPLLCLPWGIDSEGLPVSVMLAGRPGLDAALLSFGQQIAGASPGMPPPVLPAG